MYEVSEETFKKSYKPFDVVSDKKGNVGIISEVSVNNCQETFDSQISYAVKWLTGKNNQTAWFAHNDLSRHCNLMVKLAECTASAQGNNARHVGSLFRNM